MSATVQVERSTVAGNSLRVLSAQVAGNLGYFASVLLLARTLTAAGRGTVAFLTVTALVTSSVSAFGAGDAARVMAVKRPALRPRVLANLLVLTLSTSVAGAALATGGLLLLPGVRPAGVGHLELALLGAGAVSATGSYAAASFLQGCNRFREYTRVLAATPWIYALLLMGCWAAGGVTVPRAASAWLAAQAAPALLLWATSVRECGLGRPDLGLMREAIAFGVRAWVGTLARFLNARVDQVLMGVIASEATLGAYAVAVNAGEVLYYLPTAAGAALLPVIARPDAPARAEQTVRAFRAVLLLTMAGVALAALLGPGLLPLVFGGHYEASVRPFELLLPSAIGFAASTVFSIALLADGAPGLSSLGATVALVVGFALDLVLIPRSGASGAAAAASVALLCGGAAATVAYALRAKVTPAQLVPRRSDLGLLMAQLGQARSRLATRRAGAMRS